MVFYAVIVSYNPDLHRMESNLNVLRNQGFNILVVDNGSESPPMDLLSKEELVLLGENKGIATALNVGMETAKERGGEWVLSLDQDSEPAGNMLEEYQKYLDLPHVGALCPLVIRRGEEGKDRKDNFEEVERCPTAGFFLNVNVWETAGKYDDWMFIDYVDYEICTKIIIAGFTIYRICSTYVIQELGKLYVNPFFFKLGKLFNYKRMMNFAHTYNHSPLRNYYFIRNSTFYIHKYKKVINVRQERVHVLKWELKKLLLEPNKVAIITSIFKGLRDANHKINDGALPV